MDAIHQFPVFIRCVCVGYIGGIFYEILSVPMLVFHRTPIAKQTRATLDIVFWVTFFVWCVCVSYACNFPSLRLYMWIGYALGGILYLKTLHKIIAFFKKVCYNKAILGIKKAKEKKKLLKEIGKKL